MTDSNRTSSDATEPIDDLEAKELTAEDASQVKGGETQTLASNIQKKKTDAAGGVISNL